MFQATSRGPILALAAVVWLASGSARAAGREPARRGPDAKETACPTLELEGFLKAFADSADVQKAFTRFPLARRHLDKSAPLEPAPVVEQLPPDKVAFPVFPNEQARARQRLSLKIRGRTSSRVEVVLLEEDTGHLIVFVFERSTCWRLVLIDDQSV